jgi:hypothetical protein
MTRPGPQQQQSENPASSAADGSGQQQERRANGAGAGRSGNAKSLLPHRQEEMKTRVSLFNLSERRKNKREESFYLRKSTSLLVHSFLPYSFVLFFV